MYRVIFTTRESGSYAYEEERHEFYFRSETDANNFYNDLENFIDKAFEGNCYVVYKAKPEKTCPVELHGYDVENKRLYLLEE